MSSSRVASTASYVPQTRAGSLAGCSDDSEDDVYVYLSFSDRMELARSERASFRVEGRPVSAMSRRRIEELTRLYEQNSAVFWISSARWNAVEGPLPHPPKKPWLWKWSTAAETERPSATQPRQDFSRGIPADEEEYAMWEKEKAHRQAVPRTTLGGHKSSTTIRPTTSLPPARLPAHKLASTASDVASKTKPLKRARTESIAPSRSVERLASEPASVPVTIVRASSSVASAAAPLRAVAQTTSASSTTSSKRLKTSSSTGSTTSIHFPVTKRASISPTDSTTKPIKPRAPVVRKSSPVPVPSRSSPPPPAARARSRQPTEPPASPGRTADGREKGKTRAPTAEPAEGDAEGEVAEALREEGVRMRGITTEWDSEDADTSAFDEFLPPSFPTNLACSTPHGGQSSFFPRSSQLSGPASSPHFAPKKPSTKLGDLDAVDPKKKKRSRTTSTNTPIDPDATATDLPTSSLKPAMSLPLPPATIAAALRAVESLPPADRLAVPSRLGALSSRSASAAASGPPSSSLGGGTSASGDFSWGAIPGSQFEGRIEGIMDFLEGEEEEAGSWA